VLRKPWRIGALTMVALNAGAAYAHALELPGKMRLDGPDYLTVQQIYRTFGPVGALLEPGSLLAAAALTATERNRPAAFALGLTGTGLLAAALAAWLARVAPMNAEMETWSREAIPVDWTRVRDQWEYTHAARFALQLAGFVALSLAVLAAAETESCA
jgi:hypothetical protein